MLKLGFSWLLIKQLPTWMVRGWNHPYQDTRIILEQQGNLQYLSFPAYLQKWLARSAIVTVTSISLLLVGLMIFNIDLMISRMKLERSHEAVYRALLSSNEQDLSGQNIDESQMLTLAQAIRDRDMSIRRFVDMSMVVVSKENETIKNQLQTAGLTEKIVRIIQENSAKGGFTVSDDLKSNPLLRGKVAEDLETNRSLRDVLYALPSHMPIQAPEITSGFGIRKHPLTGKAHFHSGIDLITDTNDDRVLPVKGGVVVAAKAHPNYGNLVMIRHSNGVESIYAHLAKILVKEGQTVGTDTVLGYIGNTGVSTGKHLHLEILIGGYPVNPQNVIRTAQYVQQIKTAR
jgi:murein DD-endopeptidase MepM/ murein hydrolase activator NlpD